MGCNCRVRNSLLEKNYTLNRGAVYLDYCATAPVKKAVLARYEDALRRRWANPASQHGAGVKAYGEILHTLSFCANVFGRDRKCYFGESSSALLRRVIAGSDAECCITTETDHHSLRSILPEDTTRVIPVSSAGKMDMEALEDALDPQIKTLVLYSPLNHESGAVQEAQAVFALAKKKNALVCVDAVQALFRLPRKLWLPWADICVVSGHKIGAPMGVGLLCVREESGFDPVLHDETLEFSLFDGTCNGPGIAAFDEALRDFVQHEADIFRHLSVLTAEGIDILANAPFPVHIETPKNSRRGILCISLPNIENIEDLLIFLSGRDVYVSRFSACSGDLSRPSAVLTAMGRPRERTQKSLRISLGENSQRSDFFVLRKALTEAHNRGV